MTGYYPPLVNVVSAVNSSSAPLSASGVFTGTSVDSLTYSSITVSVDTDVAGTLDVQSSSDGTNWISNTYAVTTTKLITLNLQAQYVRVVYTNGGSPQTHFRLQTLLNSDKATDEAVVTGTVDIGNTPNVSVTNTPNVSVTNTPNVSVTNTPTVDIDNYLDYVGLTSTNNTTTTPLSGGATYTGTGEQNNHPDVLVSVYADVAGTLYLDFSVDGTNWYANPEGGYATAAGESHCHKAVKAGLYFRARYVNGAAAQSGFRLTTYFGTFGIMTTTLNKTINLDEDALLTRNTFPWLDVSRGLVSNITAIEKFGFNESVGSSWEPIAYNGVYPTPTSAVSLEFVSSSASDALNSTGMHEITIEGIDANWELQTTSVAAHATDGTTAVAIPGTWLRVFKATVTSSGAYATVTSGSHVGTITVRVASAGATYAVIPLLNSFAMGRSFIGAYSVPNTHDAYIKLKDMSSDTGKTINVSFFKREDADDTSSSYDGSIELFNIMTGLDGGQLYSASPNEVPHVITGPADVGFMGYSSGGGGNAAIAVNFEIFLIEK